ncbi:hypothetical protein [Algoriphagus sp. CAU 1675]|uniref:hypothetical protein n=1 Tax=Algoriphagus sp. CAU 1675 TaxID=3032597 RepID=UPI0023D9BA6A|nr:hypothetical protein [Algoriphagus sp. CAU 1675]MDF2157974.1 hypothetical protein [Algoriphagus sp. CAU 1675]
MIKSFLFTLSLSWFFVTHLTAQTTSFDLWQVKTEGKSNNLKIAPKTAKPITDRPEYDNQPSFINEYQMVFSAADENGNHDIIVYNFETGKFTNLSKTASVSEFSPQITDCGQYIGAVVMEEDKSQRIWLYPTNFEKPELLYDDIEPVGYYDWYKNKAAMFVLGEPNKLVYAEGRNDLIQIDENIARSVKTRPKTSQITYLSLKDPVETNNGKALTLKYFDIESKVFGELGNGLEGSQDFIWIDKNTLLMARGNTIYKRKVSEGIWKEIGTIESDTHQNISRLAYSPELQILVFAIERKNQQ